jgi:hypothetical protein
MLAGAARAAATLTDERVLIAVIGSVAIVAGIAVIRLWRG